MKKLFLTIIAATLTAAAFAQSFNSAYFTEGFDYRHQMNPAMGNDSIFYFAIPVLGNVSIGAHGNIGLKDVILKNPRYGQGSEDQLVTFLSPYISNETAMSGIQKSNKVVSDVKLTLLSFGFRGIGGYNTIELNSRTQQGTVIPYEMFSFARNIGNKSYNIGNIDTNAQSYVELALGHSHKLSDMVSFGAKLKFLFGLARVDFSMRNVTADLTSTNQWLVSADAKVDAYVKNLEYEMKEVEYKERVNPDQTPLTFNRIYKLQLKKIGLAGFGLAADLGVDVKINDDWDISASVLDLGFIKWFENSQAVNHSKQFLFNGFQEAKMKASEKGSFKDQYNSLRDDLSDFLSLEDNGVQSGTATGIGATVNVGVEYTLPVYRKLKFGLLGSAKIRAPYSWFEGRLSANWAPLKWLSGGVSLGVNDFGVSGGWILNFHPKGIDIFLGMDHIMSKRTKYWIPLTSNANFNFGVNVAL